MMTPLIKSADMSAIVKKFKAVPNKRLELYFPFPTAPNHLRFKRLWHRTSSTITVPVPS